MAIKPEHMKEAREIGDGSFFLFHFMDLPKNATKQQQTEALQQDQAWQESHNNETIRAIDYLIKAIDPENH